MKLTKLFLFLASISALVISSDGSALAATTSAPANLSVTATVVKSCSISTSPVDFGNYSALSGVANAQGSVTVTCSNCSGTSVALDYGKNVGAGNQPRMTDNGTNYLSYKLYSDSAFQTPWSGTSVPITPSTSPTPTAQVLAVYGQMPGAQNVPPGSYSDIVVATVNF
jgi:spore coat protein U-like protein